MTGLGNKVAIVGIGGCGTNIAFQFEKMGYRTIHINSSSQDESAIAGAKTIMHLNGYNGCAGNRDRAIEAISDNEEIINKLCDLEEEILFICFGAGGGTGSGIGPAIANIVAEERTDKIVCCIVALPDADEDMGYQSNAYECAKQLSEIDCIGCTLFIDNNKDLKKSVLNKKLVSVVNSFLTNDSISQYGNVDEQEKKTMLSKNGNMIIITGASDTEKVIEGITRDNIFAPLQKESTCEYIAIINKNNNGINKNDIANLVGVPQRTFIGYGSEETIVAVAGLDFPLDHIIEIGSNAKAKDNERQVVKSKVRLDDLGLTSTAVASKEHVEISETQKKKSSRETLLRLRG